MCNKRCTLRRFIKVIGFVALQEARLDACMENEVMKLSEDGWSPLSCCCGHGRYHKTIVLFDGGGGAKEHFSGVKIDRRARFYKRDAEGLYFIPEVEAHYAKIESPEVKEAK